MTTTPTHSLDLAVPALLAATQQAALASAVWAGRGDKGSADEAAVRAMRETLRQAPVHGVVVIGEGEKDDAPMLHAGEEVGLGEPLSIDLAVDPLENTSACARGADGAVAVLAASPRGTMWDTPGWYMEKLIVGAEAADAIAIDRPVADNVRAIAASLGKEVEQLVAVVLDKPRHQELIAELRRTGCCVSLIPDGDVLGALRVLMPDGDADFVIGVGGAPEGVINACSARALGGNMQARLAPQSDEEAKRIADAGQNPDTVLTLDDLVAADETVTVVSGVTTGTLLRGPRVTSAGVRTESIVLCPLHPGLLVTGTHPDNRSHPNSAERSLAHA